MRTAGIVAEYNPFHTGHKYHLQKAKEQSGADFSVAVMSPDFVQRGEPAIFDKYTRAKMALLSGADLVIELPVCYASGSAKYFAEGAVSMLNALGIIDTLCFGNETTEKADTFQKAAGFLLHEPEAYRKSLQNNLRKGMTFPQARASAVSACGFDAMADLLASPNNILGVEYCRALQKSDSRIVPLPIKRKASSYTSEALDGTYVSASAIRKAIESDHIASSGQRSAQASPYGSLAQYIPEEVSDLFQQARKMPFPAESLLPILHQKLLFRDRFDDIVDISADLSDRIHNLRYVCAGKNYHEITAILKSKQFTEARIRRALLHLILDIRKDAVEAYRTEGTVFYAHVLGFRKSASPLLHAIKKRSAVPLLTKASHASELLTGIGLQMWKQDIAASHLYRSSLTARYQIPFQAEYEISPIVL